MTAQEPRTSLNEQNRYSKLQKTKATDFEMTVMSSSVTSELQQTRGGRAHLVRPATESSRLLVDSSRGAAIRSDYSAVDGCFSGGYVGAPDPQRVQTSPETAIGVNPAMRDNATYHPNSPPPYVTTEDMCVEYPNRESFALKDLSISIAPGERVALIGINGGGKSTFFKTLALAKTVPVRGRVCVSGREAVEGRWSLGPQGALGYVPQDGGLPEFMTVTDALSLFQGISLGASVPRISGSSVLPRRYLRYPIHALSGGNKRKLSVVLSNVNNAKLLLLDEPTSGVDPVAAERIVAYLKGIQPHQGVIFSSHRIHECLRVCTRVLMLYNGRLHFDGPMDTFDKLASLFYQLDITLPSRDEVSDSSSLNVAPASKVVKSCVDEVISELKEVVCAGAGRPRDAQNEDQSIRVVRYSDFFVRITCKKTAFPLSRMWTALMNIRDRGDVLKFSFRCMDMEDVLSFVIELSGRV